MVEKILRLGKETAVYGLSTVVGRLLNFLIVPFYANVLLPEENGVIANVYAYIAFAAVVYGYGMEQAYMRFVASQEIGDKKQNFTVPFLSLAGTSVLLSLVIHTSSTTIAALIGLDPSQHILVRYAGWILCFDTLAVVPFASLRMQQRAKKFASLKILNVSTNLILNVVLIVGFHRRAEGVFLANLLASVFTFCVMLNLVREQISFDIPGRLYKEILKFGLPYIPAGLSGVAMQVVDRPIVRALTNDATLGVYQLNYRLGIFMMLIVGMFDYAWRPFFLNHATDPDAKQLFSKVFTYFLLAMTSIFLVVSFFIEDVVRMSIFGRQFFPPAYWPGVQIVPYILLSYVFTGAYVVFVVGVYLEKKTKYLPLVTGAGALVNIGLNFLLIPIYGILGAALATLCSYIVMAVGMFLASQRFYPVQYEWNKVVRLSFVVAVLFVAFKLLSPEPLSFSGVLLKLAFLSAFVASLFALNIVSMKEFVLTKSAILKTLTSPGKTPEA
ncbi:MAG: polysaccharide biosynthesis C-terminal domain-containing protein [Bacteroidota bacterium]